MNVYRKCAGIIVFNALKKVLVCARNDAFSFNWQFPQGGIENNETPLDAALRELKEETSMVSVKLIHTLEEPTRYDFPDKVLNQSKGIGKAFAGQDVYWSLLFFYGSDDEINLATKEPEFKSFEWVEPNEAICRIIDFKKNAYKTALMSLTPIIENYKV